MPRQQSPTTLTHETHTTLRTHTPQFTQVASSVEAGALEEASEGAVAVASAAARFHVRMHRVLRAARARLACCEAQHSLQVSASLLFVCSLNTALTKMHHHHTRREALCHKAQ